MEGSSAVSKLLMFFSGFPARKLANIKGDFSDVFASLSALFSFNFTLAVIVHARKFILKVDLNFSPWMNFATNDEPM